MPHRPARPTEDVVADWAARFTEHTQGAARKQLRIDESSSEESAEDTGFILTEEVLTKMFDRLTDSQRLANVTGERLREHFAVKVRGCDRTE